MNTPAPPSFLNFDDDDQPAQPTAPVEPALIPDDARAALKEAASAVGKRAKKVKTVGQKMLVGFTWPPEGYRMAGRMLGENERLSFREPVRWRWVATRAALCAVPILLAFGVAEWRQHQWMVEGEAANAASIAAAAEIASKPEQPHDMDGKGHGDTTRTALIEVGALTDAPATATQSTCLENVPAMKTVSLVEWPSAEAMGKIQGWRLFTSQCQTLAGKEGRAGQFSISISTNGLAAIKGIEPPSRPSAASRDICVENLATINRVALDALPSGAETPKVLAWRSFTDMCRSIHPDPFTGAPGSFTAATAVVQEHATTAPSNADQVPVAPVMAAASATAVETTPPVPPTATKQTCELGLGTLNRVHGLTGALSDREQAWATFGYACLALNPAPLVASSTGFELAAKPVVAVKPEAAKTDEVAKQSTQPDGKPRVAKSVPAPKPPGASAGELPTAVSCGARLADINALAGHPVAGLTPQQQAVMALASRCIAARIITPGLTGGFVLAAPAVQGAPGVGVAGRTCALRGAVVSQDGSPLAGATVELVGQGIAAHTTMTTDANGGWSTAPLPDGNVQITVRAVRHFDSRTTQATCPAIPAQPIRLETCNPFTCGVRKLDQKLGLGH